MTSAFEGFPNTVVEAQSFGCVPFLFNTFSIAPWMVNDGKFQERGVTDRAMVFAWMIAPDMMNCSTQAQLAERMNLSRSQVNEYVKQFTNRFGFVSGSTYTERQRQCRKK